MNETFEQQQKDSNMIFNQITGGDFSGVPWARIETFVMSMYGMDRSVSRSGISHALKRLEKHFAANP